MELYNLTRGQTAEENLTSESDDTYGIIDDVKTQVEKLVRKNSWSCSDILYTMFERDGDGVCLILQCPSHLKVYVMNDQCYNNTVDRSRYFHVIDLNTNIATTYSLL